MCWWRYADHLPLYRQAQIMARQGVVLERSTLAFWVGYAAAEIAPVVSRLKEILLSSARVFADETTVPVLDPGRGRTKTGYFWAVARDDRPWGGADPPAVVYSYAPGRGQEHNDRLLGAYRGILQCDGYATYKKLAGPKDDGGAVTLVFGWSHVRRGFYDLAKAGAAPIAVEALARIAALYRIEAEVRGKTADRLAARQAKSRPLVTDLRAWFEAQIATPPGRRHGGAPFPARFPPPSCPALPHPGNDSIGYFPREARPGRASCPFPTYHPWTHKLQSDNIKFMETRRQSWHSR